MFSGFFSASSIPPVRAGPSSGIRPSDRIAAVLSGSTSPMIDSPGCC
jgi:hypothetical protein